MIKIKGREISTDHNPYIIAELSANHSGSIDVALETIKAAKEFGADAIKLQTYNAKSMTLDSEKDDFLIKEGLWKGRRLYDLYNEASTPYEWHKELFKYARKLGITIFSSPFDEFAVDLLDDLGAPAFKIASFEIIDLPLIKYAASKGKPLLISTGMASENEIDDAVRIAKKYGNGEILLFHCISNYPAPTKDSNLKMIATLRQKYKCEIGLSDHTLNNTAALAAVALGACAVEKHFILNKKIGGPDSYFSILPKELNSLKTKTYECWQALGSGTFTRPLSEKKNQVFRRSLYFVKNMNKGDLIKEEHVRRIRPGYGISPKFYEQILNKRVNKSVKVGDRVEWSLIEN